MDTKPLVGMLYCQILPRNYLPLRQCPTPATSFKEEMSCSASSGASGGLHLSPLIATVRISLTNDTKLSSDRWVEPYWMG